MYELKRTDPNSPMHKYLQDRIEYYDSYVKQLESMMGKKLPPNKRAKRMD